MTKRDELKAMIKERDRLNRESSQATRAIHRLQWEMLKEEYNVSKDDIVLDRDDKPCLVVAITADHVEESVNYQPSLQVRRETKTGGWHKRTTAVLHRWRKPGEPERTVEVVITRGRLATLSLINSPLCPSVVNDDGRRKRWVGIGWVDEGPADGTEVRVVDN